MVSCFRRHQQHKRILCCVSQYYGGFLHFIGILQGIAAGIGTSNFLRAAIIVSLNSSSFGSMKNIPLNCLALSGFGFLDSPFLLRFTFRYIGHMLPRIWPYIVRTRGCLFPCKSLTGPCISVRWPFFNKMNLVKPVHASDNSFLHPRSSNLQYFLLQYIHRCICCSGNVDVLQRNRKCFFFRDVQFDSEYKVMTIN